MKKVISYNSKNTKRIDSFIKGKFPYLSKSEILTLLGSSKVTVNGKKADKGYRLKPKDKINLNSIPDDNYAKVRPAKASKLKILYKDDYIIAAYKEKGIPTHPIKYSEKDTLLNALIGKYPEIAKVNKSIDGGLLNRLDNDTTGIVLAARTKEAFKIFKNLFKRKNIYKEYLALVHGKTDKEGTITFPITRTTKRKMKVIKNDKHPGKNRIFQALTSYETLHRFKKFSFLKITLTSAVTHQIRVHLASIGHPLVGDSLYNDNPSSDREINGHYLHSNSVEFKHPFTGENIKIFCTIDKELTKLLNRLF